MSKTMFGLGAALALTLSPAWAGEESSEGKASGDAVARSEALVSQVESVTGAMKAGDGAGDTSNEVRAAHDAKESFEERWLREREGYRDGGY